LIAANGFKNSTSMELKWSLMENQLSKTRVVWCKFPAPRSTFNVQQAIGWKIGIKILNSVMDTIVYVGTGT
jgi:hypothetical protein